MGGTPVIGHVRGVEIRAHAVLLLAPPYLAFLAAARLGEMSRAADAGALLLPRPVWGLLVGALALGALLVHEAGHVLVVRLSGGRVTSLLLLPPGGRVQAAGLAQGPRMQALVALGGPVASLSFGAFALLLREAAGTGDLAFGLAWAGFLSCGLGVLNLMPGHPMDGGRVLEAVLSLRLGAERARLWAARGGMVCGAVLLGAGLADGSLLLPLLAVFVLAGVREELAEHRQETRRRSLVVRDAMSPVRTVVEARATAAEAAASLSRERVTALPVVDGPRLVGVVSVRHLMLLPAETLQHTPVSAVASTDVPRLHAHEPLAGALARMDEKGVREAPVLDRGRLVGVLEADGTGLVSRTGTREPAPWTGRERPLPSPEPLSQPAAPPLPYLWPGARPAQA